MIYQDRQCENYNNFGQQEGSTARTKMTKDKDCEPETPKQKPESQSDALKRVLEHQQKVEEELLVIIYL